MNEDWNSTGTVVEEDANEDRMDSEYQYVIGHITQHDVMLDGQVVVPAGKEVTAADAAGALAAGVLEDLAFAVAPGETSRTAVHASPPDVDSGETIGANDGVITP